MADSSGICVSLIFIGVPLMSRSMDRAANAQAAPRKGLSGQALLRKIDTCFKEIPDHRRAASVKIPLSDALMSGFAIFSLKFPSLLQFEEQARAFELAKDPEAKLSSNLKSIYGVTQIASDTQVRSILDPVYPETLRPAFNDLFSEFQRGGELKEFAFHLDHYLLSLDGSGYFGSDDIHCDSCMKKVLKKNKNRDKDQVSYYHQMLAGSLVHPDKKQVIPFCPEPILKQDGHDKNDCERNASRRFLIKFREDHPQLKIIVIQDAIAASVPYIQDLKNFQMSYILGVKPGSHDTLFKGLETQQKMGNVHHFEQSEIIGEKVKKKRTHRFRYANNVLLSGTDTSLTVNFLEYWEETVWQDPKGRGEKRTLVHFSWITDFELKQNNLMKIMRGGRARWKIENETFNTLKNQGYEFEHNFGHGYKNLTTVFAYLMMLAFLFDQIQQASCALFQAALERCFKKRTVLWRYFKSLYTLAAVTDWTAFLDCIAHPDRWKMVPDTS
jgi:hypothetical protein